LTSSDPDPASHASRFRPPSSAGRYRIVYKGFTGRAIFAVLLLLAAVAGSLLGLLLIYSVDMPQIAALERYHPNATTQLLDIHGRVFGSFALERRVVVPYSAFSPVLREAVISIEDKNFESHWGVNAMRVAGAAYHDLVSNGRVQGASTLTMQLARNLFLSPRRTLARKLQEVVLSVQIERHFTKDQIFALYANQIYLGQGVYGSKRDRNITSASTLTLSRFRRRLCWRACPKDPWRTPRF